jgi:hypothetical protein
MQRVGRSEKEKQGRTNESILVSARKLEPKLVILPGAKEDVNQNLPRRGKQSDEEDETRWPNLLHDRRQM